MALIGLACEGSTEESLGAHCLPANQPIPGNCPSDCRRTYAWGHALSVARTTLDAGAICLVILGHAYSIALRYDAKAHLRRFGND